MSEKSKELPIFAEEKGDAIRLFFASGGNAIFMHGANCQKVMGAGIAAQVRDTVAPLYFLDQFDARQTSQRFGNFSALLLAENKDGIKIGVNLYTQYNPGANFDIVALKSALRAFKFTIKPENRGAFTIFLPWIGCGIGGGNWKEVKPVIMKELAEFNVVAVEYKPTITKGPELEHPDEQSDEVPGPSPTKSTRRSNKK